MLYTINKELILESLGDTVKNAASATYNGIKNVDLNSKRDKLMDNAGLISGAVIGAGLLGSGVADNMDSSVSTPMSTIGLAGALGGTAGAGIGHVIHNQFKKKPEVQTYPTY